MKIGIMSMQRIANYGSFLQAYALREIIKSINHDEVIFVDYHIGKPLITNRCDNCNSFFRNFKKVVDALKIDAPLPHRIKYINFKKNYAHNFLGILNITEEKNYDTDLDRLVIGSDEVFNCIQENTNVGYSIDLFGGNCKANKCISYAASFGNTTIDKLYEYNKAYEIRELLKKFSAISVRDRNSFNIINKLLKIDSFYNVDPVLAYDWKKNNKIPTIDIKEKFIILYAYAGRIRKDESKCIRRYADKKGFKIYAIGGPQRCADKYIDCSPFDVLGYFNNAEEIITDTFHGTVFSIINQKRFVTIVRKSVGYKYGNEEKLSDLLNHFRLSNRKVENIKTINDVMLKDIKWDNVNRILNDDKQNTINYLATNLMGN